MSSISGYGNSRGNYTQLLRAQSGQHKDHRHSEKAQNNVKKTKAEEYKLSAAKAEDSKTIKVAKTAESLGSRLDVTDETVKQNNRQSVARDKGLARDITQASRASAARDKVLGEKIDDLGNAVDDRLNETDQKIDDLGSRVDDRFNDVDRKLNDVTNELGDKLDNVVDDLSTAITDLKEVIQEGDTGSNSKLTNAVKDLRNDFNKQFSDLKAQHEFETNALLEKLNDVTQQLKTLSEQSTEQTSVLKDKLGGLGGQLGTIINKLDLLGTGQNLSLRSIGLFDVAAKAGNGALDKLIGIVGPNGTGNQLRSVQSRLQSVSSRFGVGQPAAALNLLA